LIFKDLKKIVSLQVATAQQQQSKLFERLWNKPFWVWDKQQHKLEDIRTNGDCCFNHITGLPSKNTAYKPLYDYEKFIFDCLVTLYDDYSNSSNNKHLWIKKATGLGVSEFMLRFMAWLA
jgi:hypothetical protein